MSELQCMKTMFARKRYSFFFLTDALKEPQQQERLPSVCKLDIVISLTKSWIHMELLQAIKRKHFSQEAHVLHAQ